MTAAPRARAADDGDRAPASRSAPGSRRVELRYAGLARSYLYHAPARAAPGEPLPVVLNFHGATSNGEQQERYSGMDAIADRDGFVAVYPNGTGRGARALFWNAGGCCGYAMRNRVDDVGFTRALLDDLAARVVIDRRRVYATGLSNGAMMAFRLGVEAQDRVAAIAPVEGALMIGVTAFARPMPLMLFNSVDDRYVPYGGRFGRLGKIAHVMPYPAVDEEIARWRGLDSCPAEPKVGPELRGRAGTADAGNSATRYEWGPCAGGSRIVLWKLAGSGHVWPGTAHSLSWLGHSTTVIDGNEEMWRFFRASALPP
ncbi:MAG TPA: PHB depolymerase family esterase [Candidatus Binataceae bacterium]|nr:PHB depolymerase family esterase [Candidatus Binataceae bacterium]